MMKELLVHVPTTQSAKPVIDTAVSLAKSLGTRLDAIAFGYEPVTAELAFDGAVAVASVMELQRERALKEAADALAAFEAAAKQQGVAYSSRAFSATPAEAAEAAEGLARLHDLTIVGQADSERSKLYDIVPEAVLFGSGRPMLMVPYIHQGAFDASRILICWDGKRAAARAVHDAMPFITRATNVDIIAANEEKDGVSEASSAALSEYFSRRNITTRVQHVTGDRAEIHNLILSFAADCGASLLVMGGYGHSRLREFVLGGVTRGILRSMTIPALMSH